MSRRHKTRPAGNQPNTETVAVQDAFSNPLFRLGWGSQSPLEATEYPLTRMTDNYALLNSLSRTEWVVQNVVDLMVDDMLREWYKLTGAFSPEMQAKIDRAEREVNIRGSLKRGLSLGRLYGGAVGIILIRGQEDLSKPLDLGMIFPDTFKGLMILDRWHGVSPNLGLVFERGEEVPESYSIVDGMGHAVTKVHHSRVVRFIGRELPPIEREAEMYWGESEVEPIYKEIVALNNVSANMAALTFQANINTMEVPGLEQLFSIGASQAQKRFWNTMQAQSVLRSNFGVQLVEKDTKLTNTQYSFTGLQDVYESMCMNLCGGSHYPMTKLFGRSPAGMNATGESDLRNYYDYVDSQREAKLRPALQKLLPVLAMSAWGYIPEDLDFSFPPLWTPTAMETAEIALKKAQAIRDTFQAGLFGADTAMKELKKLEDETGMFGSITDEEIAASAGQTYQDVTALRDPLMGLGYETPEGETGGEESAPFDRTARDAAVVDYNPYRDPQTGRYTSGPGKTSTTGNRRDTLGMSKAERRRVSSGILTDHPDLQPGDRADYFFDKHYYQFTVNGPGDYTFTRRMLIEGNEAYINLLSRR